MSDAISLRGVTKRFGGVVAVDELDLTVPRGSLYGFIGPNGSGKTTTLRMIMHILLPDEGDDRGPGRAGDAGGARPRQLPAGGARALQADDACGGCSAITAPQGARQPELDRAIDAWLERMGLSSWVDKKIEALSKGMAQKIQFIAGVLHRPELLILDEPFTGLDPVNAEVVKDAVLDLSKAGTTVVFSTHDMGVAERMCDRIFMIFRGRKVLDGTLDEIQSNYGQDTIRLRTEAGPAALEGLDGVEEVNDQGNYQEVRWRGSAGIARRDDGTDPHPPVRGRAAVAARHLRPDRDARRRARDHPHAGGHRPCVLMPARSGSSPRPSSARRSGPSRS